MWIFPLVLFLCSLYSLSLTNFIFVDSCTSLCGLSLRCKEKHLVLQLSHWAFIRGQKSRYLAPSSLVLWISFIKMIFGLDAVFCLFACLLAIFPRLFLCSLLFIPTNSKTCKHLTLWFSIIIQWRRKSSTENKFIFIFNTLLISNHQSTV